MPRTRRELVRLPDLSGMRLACSIHLDSKMLPFLFGLAEAGCSLFVTTCNPRTVRNNVVRTLRETGIEVNARKDMSAEQHDDASEAAIEWGPTHLCEMGADLSMAWSRRRKAAAATPEIRASLEATGSGIDRLQGVDLDYSVFNWDDLPAKEGLHNRFMVGLSTWVAFFSRTRLSLHEKRVVILGFGSVGRGVADAARAFGGTVAIVETDPARRAEASYRGWTTGQLDTLLPTADVLVTATGREGVIGDDAFRLLPEGAVLLNVGHVNNEIARDTLTAVDEPLPHIHRYRYDDKELFLFADGGMANLTAGEGDSINAFDVTLAVLTRAVGFIAGEAVDAVAPGLYLLPEEIWRPALEM